MKRNGFIYKGYYPQIFNSPLNSDCLTEEFEGTTESAYSYLHGNCAFFALALAKKFGYDIHVLWAISPVTFTSCFCHAYCSFDYHGDTYYVDIRGITNDYDEMIKEFEISCVDIDKERGFVCDDKFFEKTEYIKCHYKKTLVSQAMKFIKANPSFYSFN